MASLSRPILLFTDLHIGANNLELCESILKEIYDHCVMERITPYFLGDFFTAREGQPLEVQLFAAKWLKKLYNKGLIWIAGNHDKTNLNSESSYIDVHIEKRFPNEKGIDLIDFYGYDKYLFKLKERSSRCNLLLTHTGIDGFIGESPLTLDKFSDYDLIISGHYHDRQEKGNVVYMGSCYQANFGEDTRKGYAIFDGKNIDYIQTKFPVYKNYRIDSSLLEEELNRVRLDKTANFKKAIMQLPRASEVNLDRLRSENKSIVFQIEYVGAENKIVKSTINEFIPFCESLKIPEKNYKIANNVLNKLSSIN